MAGLAAVVAALASGCSDEAPDPPAVAISPETAEQLEALGYAAWTDEADTGDPLQVGVTLHDASRAAPGLNLFKDRVTDEAVLMDMDGRVLHAWKQPAPETRSPVEDTAEWQGGPDAAVQARLGVNGPDRYRSWVWGAPLPNGDLIAVAKRRYVERLDWDSNLLWSTPLVVHHDVDLDARGRVLTLTERLGTLELADGTTVEILDNEIAILDADDGRILERISLTPIFGHLVTAEHARSKKIKKGQRPADVYHSNTIHALRRDVLGLGRAGDLLLSLRNLDLIAVLDLDERRIVWSFGPGVLHRQHHPTVLANGNLLAFDNLGQEPGSRVVEIDPRSKQIVWQYRGDPPESFLSRSRGSAYAMPNGNVLVAESNRGRAFEVTRGGEIVWEYRSQIKPKKVKRKPKKIERGTLYRFARLPEAYFEPGLLSEGVRAP